MSIKTLAIAIAVIIGSSYAPDTLANFLPPDNPYHTAWQCTAESGKWVCKETSKQPGLYQIDQSYTQKTLAISHALGWISDTSDSASNCSICGGHYYVPNLNKYNQPIKPLSQSKINLSYTHATYHLAGKAVFQGPIIVTQPGRRLYADHAVVYPDKKTGKLNQIKASGNVRIRQVGMLALGSHGQADLRSHHADLHDTTYLMKVKANRHSAELRDKNFTGYAHGQAKQVQQLNKDLIKLTDANYSTCPPGSNVWRLSATKIMLNQKKGRGYSLNNIFRVHSIPVFYLPYFSFPLNDKRQSGFLFPSYGSSPTSGYSFTLPYYFNLAPNYDDTLTPTWYTKRGLYLENQFRFLNESTTANALVKWEPYDQEYGGSRSSYELDAQSQLSSHWSGALDYNYVSDPSFISDFSGASGVAAANQTLLNRSVSANYYSTHWNFSALAQSYMIIDPHLLLLANRPYNLLPQLNLSASYPQVFAPVNFSLSSQFSNFQKSPFEGTAVNGQRFNLAPTLNLPLRWASGFITPNLTLNSTIYNLQNRISGAPTDNPFPKQSIWRNVPVFDIDSGIYFDRNFLWGNQLYTQTLEPRLYYLYVPNVNQNDIPDFDTSILNFNSNSLFLNNRFSGIDRIGDANQITAALSTSISNNQGVQKLTATVGRILYFHQRQVSLCRDQPGSPSCMIIENPNYQQKYSDLVTQFGYYFNNNWNFSADTAYNFDKKVMDVQNYQFQYLPDPRHIFNVSYQSNLEDYSLLSRAQLIDGKKSPPAQSQIISSFLWQLSPRWSVIGSWNYSFTSARTVDVFAGLQYDSCCWAVRIVTHSYIISKTPNNPQDLTGPLNKALIFQFELKGLGGSSPAQLNQLLSQISEYNPQLSGF